MVEKVENKEIKITLPKSILGILTGEEPGNVVMLRARDGEHVIEINIGMLKDLEVSVSVEHGTEMED